MCSASIMNLRLTKSNGSISFKYFPISNCKGIWLRAMCSIAHSFDFTGRYGTNSPSIVSRCLTTSFTIGPFNTVFSNISNYFSGLDSLTSDFDISILYSFERISSLYAIRWAIFPYLMFAVFPPVFINYEPFNSLNDF